jgi:hypothetical protein
MEGHVMSFHVVVWLQILILAMHAGTPTPPEDKTAPALSGQPNATQASQLAGTMVPTREGVGRYAIDRIIMEGDNVPLLSQNGPYFATPVPGNITAVTGDSATLHCRVHNLGNRTVSWIRLADLNLLTVGRYTYTSDLRFEAAHQKNTQDWDLVLKDARLSDTGVYECQVSTTPHISQLTYLAVRDPDTRLLGGPEMFVESSSMINLTCVISWTSSPPSHIAWYHNHTKLTFRGPRPGVSLIVDKSEVTTVSLLLQLARLRDSGIYACKPDNAPQASIVLHVLTGDNTAELSASTGLRGDGSELAFLILTLSLICSWQHHHQR